MGPKDPHAPPAVKRVLLKLSGELLSASPGEPFDLEGLGAAAAHIEDALAAGAQVGVVLGGGNILRGARNLGAAFSRVSADAIGMVGTLVNALALQAELDRRHVPSRVLSSFDVPRVAELHRARKAREVLARGEVAIFGGGTGNPFFTTDTTAALRALESECALLIKGTKVDGVYSADPEQDPAAERFTHLTYEDVLERKLGVMDLTAITLCMENSLPVVVLNARQAGSVGRLLAGDSIGTLIRPGKEGR